MSSTPDPSTPPRTHERRTPTAAELRAWRAFVETAEAVKQETERRLQRDSGVSTGDYSVMVALSEQPGRALRSSELADVIRWERSRLSHHLGRMERRGLITRRTTVGDSRGAEVLLTDAGAALFRKASAPHLRDVHEIFVTAVTAEQLAVIEEAMRAVRVRLDDELGVP